jgi:hypothetical protein
MSSPSYFRLKPASIWTVLTGSSTSSWTALPSSVARKEPNVEGMAGLAEEGCALWHSFFSSVAATVAAANLMLFYSQSNAR